MNEKLASYIRDSLDDLSILAYDICEDDVDTYDVRVAIARARDEIVDLMQRAEYE